MPAYKHKSSVGTKLDFWGDEFEGAKFRRLIRRKFGAHFGAMIPAIAFLGRSRRLVNMYITGQRDIPSELWTALRRLPDYEADPDPLS